MQPPSDIYLVTCFGVQHRVYFYFDSYPSNTYQIQGTCSKVPKSHDMQEGIPLRRGYRISPRSNLRRRNRTRERMQVPESMMSKGSSRRSCRHQYRRTLVATAILPLSATGTCVRYCSRYITLSRNATRLCVVSFARCSLNMPACLAEPICRVRCMHCFCAMLPCMS